MQVEPNGMEPVFYNFTYVSDFATITFVVEGIEAMDYESFEGYSKDKLAEYVISPELWQVDDFDRLEIPLG